MSAVAIFIRIDGDVGAASVDRLSNSLGERLEGKLNGFPALLSKIASNGEQVLLFRAPTSDGSRSWLERLAGEIAPGVRFHIGGYDPGAYSWTGRGVVFAEEEGQTLATLAPPQLPEAWREHLGTPRF
jgi:hypothetical protein